jgi:hypothetical protein
MITKKIAETMVAEFLKHEMPNLDLRVMEQHTIEEDFGWMFFYQTKRFVDNLSTLEMKQVS